MIGHKKTHLLTALLLMLASPSTMLMATATPEVDAGHPKPNLRSSSAIQRGLMDGVLCCDPDDEPGKNGKPFCADGYICCPDNTWSCGIGDGTFPCNGDGAITMEDANPCFEPTEPPQRPSRPTCCDPAIEPGTNDVPSCEFEDYACCLDGTWGCSTGTLKFFTCGDEIADNPDGDVCQPTLPPVEPEPCCEMDLLPGTNGIEGCANGLSSACCPGGNWACRMEGGGDGFECDPGKVTESPDGEICVTTQVEPTLGCCEPAMEPGTNGNPICTDGHACCPEGVWSCSVGDGITFPCDNGDLIENPKGQICAAEEEEEDCCNPDLEIACLFGERACCPGGRWTCPDSETDLYTCEYTVDPQGPICGNADDTTGGQGCCDPQTMPLCFIGNAACCPEGNWACPNGFTNLYSCGPTKNPLGAVCAANEDKEEAANPFCFPGDATVYTKARGSTLMNDLKLGDQVLTNLGSYDKVYSFGHYQPNTSAMYMEISLTDTTFKISKDHMVFIDAAISVAAGSLKIGDKVLLASGNSSKITQIRTIRGRGAFAPFTESGAIAVNGVLASNYITMLDNHEHKLKLFDIELPISQQWVAHASQAPHRVYCRIIGGCQKETYTAEGVSHWVATPYLIVKYLLHQHSFLQALMFLFVLPIFAIVTVIEVTLVFPSLFAIIAVGLYFWARSNQGLLMSTK